MIILALGLLILLLFVGLLIYARSKHGTLEKMGIPIVPHHPILGSTREIFSGPGGLIDYSWMKKYGKIFGVNLLILFAYYYYFQLIMICLIGRFTKVENHNYSFVSQSW